MPVHQLKEHKHRPENSIFRPYGNLHFENFSPRRTMVGPVQTLDTNEYLRNFLHILRQLLIELLSYEILKLQN